MLREKYTAESPLLGGSVSFSFRKAAFFHKRDIPNKKPKNLQRPFLQKTPQKPGT
jgi:hypothetical protein